MTDQSQSNDRFEQFSQMLMERLNLKLEEKAEDPNSFLYKVPEGIHSEEGCTIMVVDFLGELYASEGKYDFFTERRYRELEAFLVDVPDEELPVIYDGLNDVRLRNMVKGYLDLVRFLKIKP
jgi:hypothetical protein